MALYRRLLRAASEHAGAASSLGVALGRLGRLTAAIALGRRAAALRPDHPETLCNLGSTLLQAARPEQGEYLFRFRQHVAHCFFEPLLAAHDRARIEPICYSATRRTDAVTARLRTLADVWRDIGGVGDAEAAALVRDDGIDVLVDLGGHSAENRLSLFARRPAPVQVTWLGYPDTTGLSAMDCRLVDAVTDPFGDADGLASETLVRLPGGFLCYRPPAEAPPVRVSERTGGVTFGSFNTLAKLTPAGTALWAAVLRAVPGSRLLLKARALADAAVRDRVEAAFAGNGVPSSRLELLAWAPGWAGHLALYDQVDVALDPFPYNGTTTTCEALWMGVPVITLAGVGHVARVGASLLVRCGLPELVATDATGYVAAAVGLARDRARLADLRAGLRTRLAVSPLTDAAGFARQVEDAYRTVWQRWCTGCRLDA